jgi:acetylornithine deacetylase/succinyl-diaminopimelate desuccinylase-like protein
MDVVPVSREFWSVDPFAGLIKDGYVWGRGALDMKGHGIIQLMTLMAIKRAGIPLTRDLVYIANADEESGGSGSQTLIALTLSLSRTSSTCSPKVVEAGSRTAKCVGSA